MRATRFLSPHAVEYLGRAPHKYNEFHERKATV